MKKLKILIILSLLFSVYFANAQLSIDTYMGYNYSKNIHEFKEEYNYIKDQIFFTDIPYDTMYYYYPFMKDSLWRVKYKIGSSIQEEETLYRNITTNYLCGISFNYRYLNYLETGLSFEKNNIIGNNSFESKKIKERFDYNNVILFEDIDSYKFNY